MAQALHIKNAIVTQIGLDTLGVNNADITAALGTVLTICGAASSLTQLDLATGNSVTAVNIGTGTANKTITVGDDGDTINLGGATNTAEVVVRGNLTVNGTEDVLGDSTFAEDVTLGDSNDDIISVKGYLQFVAGLVGSGHIDDDIPITAVAGGTRTISVDQTAAGGTNLTIQAGGNSTVNGPGTRLNLYPGAPNGTGAYGSVFFGHTAAVDAVAAYQLLVNATGNPGLRYNASVDYWELSDDGSNWYRIATGASIPLGAAYEHLEMNPGGTAWIAVQSLTLPAGASRTISIAAGGDALYVRGGNNAAGVGGQGYFQGGTGTTSGGNAYLAGGAASAGGGGSTWIDGGNGTTSDGDVNIGALSTNSVLFGGVASSVTIDFLGNNGNRINSDMIFDDASVRSIYMEAGTTNGQNLIVAAGAGSAGFGGAGYFRGGAGSTSGGGAYVQGGAGATFGGGAYVVGGTASAGGGGSVWIDGGTGTANDGSINLGGNSGDSVIFGGVGNAVNIDLMNNNGNRLVSNLVFEDSVARRIYMEANGAGAGQQIQIEGGQGTTGGGTAAVYGGSTTAGAGGDASILGGASGTGTGGNVTLIPAQGGGGNGSVVIGNSAFSTSHALFSTTAGYSQASGPGFRTQAANLWMEAWNPTTSQWERIATGGSGQALPTGTLNQVLQHNGTLWVSKDDFTLPSGAGRVINIASAATGDALSLSGGNGTAGAGGSGTLYGGAGTTAGGTANLVGGAASAGTGGSAYVQGGTGSVANGAVYLGNANTTNVYLGGATNAIRVTNPASSPVLQAIGNANINLVTTNSTELSFNGTVVPHSAAITGTNFATLFNGGDASALHTHAGLSASYVDVPVTTDAGANGDVVYIAAGDVIAVALATTLTASRAAGVRVSANTVRVAGVATGVTVENGVTVAAGDDLYLSTTGSGDVTNVAPTTSGQFLTYVGQAKTGATGPATISMYVRCERPIGL